MSLADYTSLEAAIGEWTHRTDLTSQIPDFILLFESDFNASVRVRQMEAETSQVSTAGYLLHPTNWLGWKEIRGTIDGVQYSLEPTSDEVAVAASAGDSTPALKYKVKGSKTYLYPGTSSGETFPATYYEGVALTSGTNWLLTAYPGAYLFGSLLAATTFLFDDPRIPVWQQAYTGILERIKADSRRSEWSRQALQPRHIIKLP